MMRGVIASFLAIAGSMFGSKSTAGIEYQSPQEFAANASIGEIYTCLSEDGSHALAFKVGDITQLINVGKVFHIQVSPVEPRGLPFVGHAPFSTNSFKRCLLDPSVEPLLEQPFDVDAFSEGFAAWQDNNGGVFTIDVLEIYEMLQGIGANQ